MLLKRIATITFSSLILLHASGNDTNQTKKFHPYQGKKQILIMLDTQQLLATEGGKAFLTSPVSTGRWGHETSMGDYQVLFKEKNHVSNAYPVKENGERGGAKMPYTIRFTSGGEAIHAGHLPGYPDSHGCVRMPLTKAKKLFKWAEIGMPVRVMGKTQYKDRVNQMRITMGNLSKKGHKHPKTHAVYADDDFMAGVFTD